MRRGVVALVSVAAAAAVAGVAFAKAPKPADEATVEELCEKARQAIEAGKKPDPIKEAIEKYRDKAKAPLEDWKPIVDIVNDVKTPEVQSYRDDAVTALLDRFVEGDKDPKVRSTRRDVAQALLELMKADPKKDLTGLSSIEKIINNWWRQENLMNFKFHAKDSPADRKKSYDKLKKFLKGD